MRKSVIIGSILIALMMATIGDTAYAAVAGRVQFVAGDVHILGAHGAFRVAIKGTQVHAGETILTGLRGSAQLRMIDNGFISVRSRSKLKIDEYRYEGSKSDSSFFTLVKGNFRALTGMIAKFNRKAWKTRTPTAVLGVRGSDADIGFQPDSQLTAVRTYTGGYTLTPRDPNLPPLNVDAGGIGLFSAGSAPVMGASFPFAPPAPPPQPGGGASPHDEPSPGAPPEGERSLPPAPTHVPGAAPDPLASSPAGDSTPAQIAQELPPLPAQFQEISTTAQISAAVAAPTTPTQFTQGPAPLGSGGAFAWLSDGDGYQPESASMVVDATKTATFGANGELILAAPNINQIFSFDSNTATLANSGFVAIPSLTGGTEYSAGWGVWAGNYTVVQQFWPFTNTPLGGFNYAWADRVTTAAELGALSGLGFTYTMVGGNATNELGAVATAFNVGATGTFAADATLGTITVSTTAAFPTGTTNWSLTTSGTVASLILPNGGVYTTAAGSCTGCTLTPVTQGVGRANGQANGQFVGTKAEGLTLGVHGYGGFNKFLVGSAVLKR